MKERASVPIITSTEEWLLSRLRTGACRAAELIEERADAELAIRRLLRDGVAVLNDGRLAMAPDPESDSRDDDAVLTTVVRTNAPLTLAHLAKLLPELNRRAISSAIHRLADAGLINRAYTHSRAIHWRASDEGKERFAADETAI